MSVRTRLAAGLLSVGLLLIPNLAKAESSSFSSRISEVDACKAMPTNRPILLPNPVQIPIIWNGWL